MLFVTQGCSRRISTEKFWLEANLGSLVTWDRLSQSTYRQLAQHHLQRLLSLDPETAEFLTARQLTLAPLLGPDTL